MKRITFIFTVTLFVNSLFSQSETYANLVHQADSLYRIKEYKNSATTYSAAFQSNGWKGYSEDRYNAACSWALSNGIDSAFFQLERITTKSNYSNLAHISIDPDLNSLHEDKRWIKILDKVKENKDKIEINYNKPLIAILDSVYMEDQKYRHQLKEIEEKYGWESNELKNQWKLINEKDSINLIKVLAILDKYGWLGADVVGPQGNSTLFLVIQHSDLKTQEKYLPMMREAVKNGKAAGSSLALLEDRVALGQGKKQIYGSQIGRDLETQKYYVLPLEDPDNVDKRRAEVGLGTLAEYASYFQIVWDLEQYKKDLHKL